MFIFCYYVCFDFVVVRNSLGKNFSIKWCKCIYIIFKLFKKWCVVNDIVFDDFCYVSSKFFCG